MLFVIGQVILEDVIISTSAFLLAVGRIVNSNIPVVNQGGSFFTVSSASAQV